MRDVSEVQDGVDRSETKNFKDTEGIQNVVCKINGLLYILLEYVTPHLHCAQLRLP
jgi:hypothetical protein